MRQLLSSISQKLRLPTLCELCRQYHRDAESVCDPCISQLDTLGPSCIYCAHPLDNADFLYCGQCCKEPPYFDQAVIGYPYKEPLRTLIHQFKFGNKLYLGSFLAIIMEHRISKSETKPQCLIPVPLHDKRLKKRGYNQAAVLTKLLAKKIQIPYQLNSCRKIINTVPQAESAQQKRKTNLKKAFKVKTVPYQHIALVDDLLTTGSTANELAKCFKKAGVKQVDIWCCARTVLHSH